MTRIRKIAMLAAAFVVFFAASSYLIYREPDVEKILENSPLKDRKFVSKIQKIRTPAGINAYLMSDNSSPIVSLNFKFLRSGIAYESEDIGAPMFLSNIWGDDAKGMTAEELREFLLQNGIKIGFSASFDDFDGNIALPKQNLSSSLEVIGEIFNNPLFVDQNMSTVKAQLVLANLAQNENEREIFDAFARKNLYKKHPYSRDKIASIESIKNISANDLKQYMAKYFAKDNLLVGVSGDIDEKAAANLIDTMFGKLSQSRKKIDIEAAEPDFSQNDFSLERPDFAQNKIMMVAKGISRDNPDFYPLYIADEIFGGKGLGTRLNNELRAKRGLTYGAYSWLQMQNSANLLVGFFETSPDNFAEAMKIAREEWQKFGDKGITKKEFNQTVDYLLSSYNLRFASTENISSMLTEIQKYNLGEDFLLRRNDYIKAVDFEEVNSAAKKYFNDSLIFISIGDMDHE